MYLPEIEASAIMLYLYLVSCSFLLYLLLHLVHHPSSHAHVKSHGSAFLRQGAFVFGVGSFIYHLLEFTTYFIIDLHPNCVDVLHTFNSFLAILYVVLQMVTIIMYPRLNIHQGNGYPHLGLMHLLATNLIIWMRTVIKESVHEFHVAEEKIEGHHQNIDEGSFDTVVVHSIHEDIAGDSPRQSLTHSIQKRYSEHDNLEHTHIEHFAPESCVEMYHDDDFVSDVLKASSPFLFAFIIEFSLVGSTVFYNMWNNVHQVLSEEDEEKAPTLAVQKPNLCANLAKINWSNSTFGTFCGVFILILTIMDLIIFFSVDYEEDIVFEYMGKVMNGFINICGIIAAIVGCNQIQKLDEKSQGSDNSVDLFLLHLGVFFIYVYSSLTITVGFFTEDDAIPSIVHIFNGVIEIIAVTLQIILIHLLLKRTISTDDATLHGRQVIAFLSFLNFSIWLFDTFELQKSKASLVEAEFYGHLAWVWMQRITLPLCIFFRFHSTVVLVDCWKNSYRVETITSLITNINRMYI